MLPPYRVVSNECLRTGYSKPWRIVCDHDPGFSHLCGDLLLALDEADKLNIQHEDEQRLAAWEAQGECA